MSQRGNILFLILLAVALFAALSYAVTSSMRGSGADASRENTQTAVSDILNFFTATENAVNRMRLVSGLAPENISFGYNYMQYGGSTNYGHDNTNCASDTCRVFKPTGGGIEARTFEKYAVPDPAGIQAANVKPGYFNIVPMQFPYAGTNANDIVLLLSFIKQDICQEFNNRMGITASPSMTGTWLDAKNTANWDNAAYTINANANQIIGKTSFAHNFYSGYCNITLLLIAR